jgi:hypothetical protein
MKWWSDSLTNPLSRFAKPSNSCWREANLVDGRGSCRHNSFLGVVSARGVSTWGMTDFMRNHTIEASYVSIREILAAIEQDLRTATIGLC